MSAPTRRPWAFGRLARGSRPPSNAANRDWIASAVRAHFPKLATALGDAAFGELLAAYFLHAPDARSPKLADFLAGSANFPVWYAELATLDRARVDVLHAPAATTLLRRDLTLERELRLVPAHALVELTTTSDELWAALHTGQPTTTPSTLQWPRTVLVWRTEGLTVRDRTVLPDEAAALRAASRGTSLIELTAGFGGDNPRARALDIVLGWLDAGALVR